MAVSKTERERRAAERKRKFEERKAAMDKKIQEVQEGRAAGMTMTEIRAKRMNISAKELKQKQLATLLGMGEGMAMFLPFGAAVRGGMLVYKGLKGAQAAKALKTAAAAKKAADAKKVSSATSNTKPRVRVPAGSSKPRTAPNTAKEAGRGGTAPKTKPRVRVKAGSNKPRTAPNTAKEAGRTKLTPKGKKLVAAGAAGAAAGLTALGLAGKSTYDAVTKKDKSTRGPARTTPDTSSERGRKGTPKRAGKPRTAPNVASEAGRSGTPKRKAPKSSGKPRFAPGMNVLKDIDYSIYGESSPSKKKNNGAKPTPNKRTAPNVVSEAGRKGTPKRTGKLRTAPNTASEAGRKGTPKRTTKITAGSGVGFGPKGNQYPKDAADRRRLMAMYGGTGSAAAKAAAQGKQGNLKKGKK